jgi:hypothetical protein
MKKVVEGHTEPHKTPPSCLLIRLTSLHRIDGVTKIAKKMKMVTKIINNKNNHKRMFTVELCQIEKANKFS